MAARKKTITPDYETTDLYFAAFLQVRGVRLLRTTRTAGRMTFVFSGSDDIQTMKEDWFGMTGTVPALPYANSLKNLKHLALDRA